MPIIVHSPFSGQPVKIRDQDVGRAIRDQEGRIFYAVPKTDGSGYYGSPTRKGSEKDEQRYDDMMLKGGVAESLAKAQQAAVQPQVHDATGRPRGKAGRLLVLLILLALIGVAVYVGVVGVDNVPVLRDLLNDGAAPTTPAPPDGSATPDAAPALSPEGEQAPVSLMDDGPRLSPAALAMVMRAGSPSFEEAPSAGVRVTPAAASRSPVQQATLPAPTPQPAIEKPASVVTPLAEPAPASRPFIRTASGLRYRIEEEGTGAAASAGQFVLVHYTAALHNGGEGAGKIIDTSRGGLPLGFVLWSGQVIRGWDEGIAGMRVGEVRTLVIPAELAGAVHSTRAATHFPEAGLVCEIELVGVRPGIGQIVERVGSGRLAYPGETVELHYTASLAGRDKPFDNSRQYNQPLRMTIGRGEVIAGLELGVTGMAEGEFRRLTIPAYLAYGSRGCGELIPPDSDLVYEVELLRVLEK